MKYLAVIFCVLFSVLSLAPAIADYYDDSLTQEQIDLLKRQAEKGDAEAQFNLATAYHKGDGIEQDDQVATRWYIKSAEQGYAEAQFALGFVYRGGNGVAMDTVRSYMWFDIAANNGYEKAIELRKDLATSMTDDEIAQARKQAEVWRSDHHF